MQTRTGRSMVRVQFLVPAVAVECLVQAVEFLGVNQTVQIVEMAHKQPGLPAHGRKSNLINTIKNHGWNLFGTTSTQQFLGVYHEKQQHC